MSSLGDAHTPEGLPLVCGVPLQGAAGLSSGAQVHPDRAPSPSRVPVLGC